MKRRVIRIDRSVTQAHTAKVKVWIGLGVAQVIQKTLRIGIASTPFEGVESVAQDKSWRVPGIAGKEKPARGELCAIGRR